MSCPRDRDWSLTVILLTVLLARSAQPTKCPFSAASQFLDLVGDRTGDSGDEDHDICLQEYYDCPGRDDPAEATSCCSQGCCFTSSQSNLIIVIILAIIDFTLVAALAICCCYKKCPLYENINFSSLRRKPRFQSRIKYSKTETRILKY